MKRRTFTKEFKVEACKMVTEQGQKISQTARDLGIGEPLLGRWVHEYRASLEPGAQEALANSRRIKELEAENRRLRMEREILKKAMAYFVEPPK